MELSNGWHRRPDGEIWSSDSPRAYPILYRSGDKWMVCGMHFAEDLVTIAASAALADMPVPSEVKG